MTDMDLKTIERATYRGSFSDGLLDLFAGIALSFLGLLWLTDYAAFGGLAPALLIPVWPIARRRWVEPRMGYALPNEPRRRKLRMGMLTSITLGVIALLAGIGAYVSLGSDGFSVEGVFDRIGPGLPAFLLALMGGTAALAFDLPRFYAYSGVLVLAGLMGVSFDQEPARSLLVSGLIVSISGLTMLVRFLRNNPVLEV
jgi:hypothetical protein